MLEPALCQRRYMYSSIIFLGGLALTLLSGHAIGSRFPMSNRFAAAMGILAVGSFALSRLLFSPIAALLAAATALTAVTAFYSSYVIPYLRDPMRWENIFEQERLAALAKRSAAANRQPPPGASPPSSS